MTETFTAEERKAMRELAKERKAHESREEALATCMARIESMHPEDRALALALHELALKVNPDFEVKTWYGMPGYFDDGKIVMFFQDGHKYKTRYSTVGFQQAVKLDDSNLWPTSFALTAWSSEVSRQINNLIVKALG